MNDEITKNEGAPNSADAGTGHDERRDSGEARHDIASGGVLGEETEGSGARSSDEEQGGASGNLPLSWGFSQIWNKSLESREDRKTEPRDHLWATDLGKPMVDVYLKLRGEQPSNPPNPRSKRKFEAGNIWEWIVKLILIRANILRTSQQRVEFQYPGLIKTTGKMDFVAGGKPDYDNARKEVDAMAQLGMPESFVLATERIIEYLREKYPEGLGLKPLEIKSVSAFMFDALEAKKHSNLRIHRLQLFHQIKSAGMPVGNIVYICRDDCRMMESSVFLNDARTEKEYHDYIERLTKYHEANEHPPLEDPIVFDEDLGKFSKNNQIAWSPYLTKLYGIQDQAEFDDKYGPPATKWNRVIMRIKKGDTMTKKNLEALDEIKAAGFDVEGIKARMTVTNDDETVPV